MTMVQYRIEEGIASAWNRTAERNTEMETSRGNTDFPRVNSRSLLWRTLPSFQEGIGLTGSQNESKKSPLVTFFKTILREMKERMTEADMFFEFISRFIWKCETVILGPRTSWFLVVLSNRWEKLAVSKHNQFKEFCGNTKSCMTCSNISFCPGVAA